MPHFFPQSGVFRWRSISHLPPAKETQETARARSLRSHHALAVKSKKPSEPELQMWTLRAKQPFRSLSTTCHSQRMGPASTTTLQVRCTTFQTSRDQRHQPVTSVLATDRRPACVPTQPVRPRQQERRAQASVVLPAHARVEKS